MGVTLTGSEVPNRFLTSTDWDGYVKILEALPGRVHVTYDRGRLELMTPSSRHEKIKKIIAALIECLLEELEVDFQGGGATTLRKELLDRGLEPDECYWTRRIVEARRFNTMQDELVAPDLAVEVEVSISALDRMGIYAALGVPEVWRWMDKAGGHLRFHVLVQPGRYDESPVSPTVPRLDPSDFERFVHMGMEQTQYQVVRQFRAWIRSHREELQ